MSFTYVPITGSYETPSGVAASGSVIFRPTSVMRNGSITAPTAVEVDLVAGSLPAGLTLAATDDVGTLPSGVTYEVVERINGAGNRSYYISVLSTAGSIDLAAVVLAQPLLPVVDAYQLVSERGIPNGYASLGTDGKVPSAQLPAATVGGVTDHGALTGLADDDHTQYLNNTRGDARYSLTSHNHDDRYYTEVETDALLAGKQVSGDYATNTSLSSHATNTSNPHSVTKAQVGLGSVDNTADTDKPVSTAQQAGLDAKAAVTHSHAQSDVTGLSTSLSGKSDLGHTHTAGSITGLATVATTGDYTDLSNKPTISGSYPAYPLSGMGYHSASCTPESVAGNSGFYPWVVRVWVPAGNSITKAAMAVNGAGVRTATAANGFAVYSDDGQTLLGVSDNADDMWTTVGHRSVAFSTPVAAAASDRFVRVLVNINNYSTQPNISFCVAAGSADGFAVNGTATLQRRSAYTSAVASFPTTINPDTIGTATNYIPLILLG